MNYFKKLCIIVVFSVCALYQNTAFSVKNGAQILAEKSREHCAAIVGKPQRLSIKADVATFSLEEINRSLASAVRDFSQQDDSVKNYFSLAVVLLVQGEGGAIEMINIPFCTEYFTKEKEGAVKHEMVFSSGRNHKHAKTVENLYDFQYNHMKPLYESMKKEGPPSFHTYLAEVCSHERTEHSFKALQEQVRELYDPLKISKEIIEAKEGIKSTKGKLAAIAERLKKIKERESKEIEESERLELDKIKARYIFERKNLLLYMKEIYKPSTKSGNVSLMEKIKIERDIKQLYIEIRDFEQTIDSMESIKPIEEIVECFGRVLIGIKKLNSRFSESKSQQLLSLAQEIKILRPMFLALRTMAFYHSESAALEYVYKNFDALAEHIKKEVINKGKKVLSATYFGHTLREMCGVCTSVAYCNLNAQYTNNLVKKLQRLFGEETLVQYLITYGIKEDVRCAPASKLYFSIPYIPGDLRESGKVKDLLRSTFLVENISPLYEVYAPASEKLSEAQELASSRVIHLPFSPADRQEVSLSIFEQKQKKAQQRSSAYHAVYGDSFVFKSKEKHLKRKMEYLKSPDSLSVVPCEAVEGSPSVVPCEAVEGSSSVVFCKAYDVPVSGSFCEVVALGSPSSILCTAYDFSASGSFCEVVALGSPSVVFCKEYGISADSSLLAAGGGAKNNRGSNLYELYFR